MGREDTGYCFSGAPVAAPAPAADAAAEDDEEEDEGFDVFGRVVAVCVKSKKNRTNEQTNKK